MHHIGAHSHVDEDTGDVLDAIKRAVKTGSTAVQIYLGVKHKTTLKYKHQIIDEDKTKIRGLLEKNGMKLFVHSNLTLNLSRPAYEGHRYQWILDNLVYDMKLADEISAEGVVIHMGSHVNEMTFDEAANNMVKNIVAALNYTKRGIIIMENTAGEGSSIAHELEKLNEIYKKIPAKQRKRIGICLDTAHLYGAGYDIANCTIVQDVFNKMDKWFPGRVMLIHVNDTTAKLGSFKDIHTSIGDGNIYGNPEGDPMKCLMKEAYSRKIPMVLETRDTTKHPHEVAQLQKLSKEIASTGGASAGASAENKKQLLINIFKQLENIYDGMGDTHRSRSYKRLVKLLEGVEHPIKTVANINDVKGITDKSRSKIDEILTTGKLTTLDELLKEPEIKGLLELTSVIGVGPVAAKKFMDKGIYSVDALRDAIKNGTVELTEEQQLGLRYQKDFSMSVSRKNVETAIKQIEKLLTGIETRVEIVPAGSYRLGKKTMKDIDLLVVSDELKMSELREALQPVIADIFHIGDIQLMAAMLFSGDKVARHVDIRLIPSELLPFYLLHFGSGLEFSRRIKLLAKQRGYKLSEYGLLDIRKGKYVKGLKSEADIMKYLGVPYVEPQNRI